MKNKLHPIIFPGILLVFHCLAISGQSQQSTIEILKDTLYIPKQTAFNKANSRNTVQFELPQNTVKWLYYFESIEKMEIRDKLARNYYAPSDFLPDIAKESDPSAGYVTMRKVGPVKLEVLLLNDAGAKEFLLKQNNFYSVTRPTNYIIPGSVLCEVGDCNSSGKLMIDAKETGKLTLGFRNIDYREDAYIVLQIVALVK